MYRPVNGLPRIVSLEARDVRFPTSRSLDGSDAMHTDPDYSAAYVVLRTDADDGIEGHGLTFTSGRGTEVCVAAIRALEPFVIGRSLEAIVADMSGFWRSLVSDSQLRWLGPEKGVIHLGTAAVVNAIWDLWAKIERKPLWKLLVDLSPEDLVAMRRLPLRHRRADPGGSARSAPRRATRERSSRAGDRRFGLPRLYDVRRLARLRRRQGQDARPRSRWRRASPT